MGSAPGRSSSRFSGSSGSTGPTLSSVVLADDVDEGGASVGGDDLCRPPNSRAHSFRIIDRSFPVPAHRTRDRGEVGRRLVDLHPDVGARDVGAARSGDPLLVLPVVV